MQAVKGVGFKTHGMMGERTALKNFPTTDNLRLNGSNWTILRKW